MTTMNQIERVETRVGKLGIGVIFEIVAVREGSRRWKDEKTVDL